MQPLSWEPQAGFLTCSAPGASENHVEEYAQIRGGAGPSPHWSLEDLGWRFDLPEGDPIIARQFSAGFVFAVALVPKGRLNRISLRERKSRALKNVQTP